jgi:hypothetical protein
MGEFEGQHEGEEILFVFRRHMIAMRKGFYALLIPFAIASIPAILWPNNLNNFWIALGGLGIGLLLFFYHWVGWYFSIFLVTNQRVRQVSQRGLFGKSVIDLGLSKIQNISYNIPGLSGEVLGYGTIVIQTYVGDLVLDRIQHPSRIYNMLQDAVHKSANTSGGNHIDEEIET